MSFYDGKERELACTLALLANLILAPISAADPTVKVEVFTSAEIDVTNRIPSGAIDESRAVDTEVFQIDGLERFEEELSRGLPFESRLAKAEALNRISELTSARLETVRHAAMGLIKAHQYGIDRFPAMVFDGVAIVYGVTDVGSALRHYEQWRSGLNR